MRLLLTVLANPLLFGSISTGQLTPVVAELLGFYRASMLGADKLGAFAMTEYTATRQIYTNEYSKKHSIKTAK